MALKFLENQSSLVLGDIKSWGMTATRGQVALAGASPLYVCAFLPILHSQNHSVLGSILLEPHIPLAADEAASDVWGLLAATVGLKDALVLPCQPSLCLSLPPSLLPPSLFLSSLLLSIDLSVYLFYKDPLAKDTGTLSLCGCPGKVYCLIGGS